MLGSAMCAFIAFLSRLACQASRMSLLACIVFWLFLIKYVRDGANSLMGDLDVETSKNVCDSLGEYFGVGRDNQAALIGLGFHFLLSIQLAAIINEINWVVISG